MTYSRRRTSAGRKSRMPRAGCVLAAIGIGKFTLYVGAPATVAGSPENGEADVEKVRVEAVIHLGAVAVRDVLVSVARSPRAPRAGLPLHTAAEVRGEVELRAALVRHALAEVDEAAARLHERLHALAASEVQLEADGRESRARYRLAPFARGGAERLEDRERKGRDGHGVHRVLQREVVAARQHARVAQCEYGEARPFGLADERRAAERAAAPDAELVGRLLEPVHAALRARRFGRLDAVRRRDDARQRRVRTRLRQRRGRGHDEHADDKHADDERARRPRARIRKARYGVAFF